MFPAAFFAARLLASEAVSRVLVAKLVTVRMAAVRAVNSMLLSTLVNVSVNVVVLLAAVYGLRGRLAERELVLVIATVYAASVLHAGIKFALNAWWIIDLTGFLCRHGVHGPKAWLRTQVQGQVEAYFTRMGTWRRFAYRISGAPRPTYLVEMITREVWTVVAARIVATAAILAVYLAIFLLYTRPILIHEATRLNWLQAFLWPFGFSVDYFLGTHTAEWITSALHL